MTSRLDYKKIAPDGVKALQGLGVYVAKNTDAKLRALVELRVSQLNGCAFCLSLHTEEARSLGEEQQRLDVLSAWRETTFFTEKERAALAWAEALTHLGAHGVPDEVYTAVTGHFTEKELVDLTFIVVTMNAWNRLSVGFHNAPVRKVAPDRSRHA